MREAAVPNADALANTIAGLLGPLRPTESRVRLQEQASRGRLEPYDRRVVPRLAQAHPGNGLRKIPRP